MKTDYFNDQLENNAVVLKAGEGERLSMNGVSLTFKVSSELSNDQLGVYEIVLAPMTIGAKLHYHRFMDETFIVTQGVLTMQLGNKEYQAGSGTVAYVPRFTPHAFRNNTREEVKLLLLFNPSQKRENFFRGLQETLAEKPIDAKKYVKLYHKYDSYPVNKNDFLPIA